MVINSRTLSTSCTVVNPGTLIPSVLRQLCPSRFCILMNLWTNPTVVPQQYLMLGSDSPFQSITQNLRIHALDLSGKIVLFHSLFPRVFACGWGARFSLLLPCFWESGRIGPFRMITQRYVLSFKSRLIDDTWANVFPAGWLHDDHKFSPDLFGALAEFKFLLNKAKKQTIRDSHEKHLKVSGRNYQSLPLHYVPTEMEILGRSCDVVNHGSPLEIVLSRSLFECIDFQRLSQIVANITRENLAGRGGNNESPLDWDRKMQNWTTCLACQKKKNRALSQSCHSQRLSPLGKRRWIVKKALWILEFNSSFFKPALKARGITNTDISCGMFRKFLTTSMGPLIVPNLMNSLLWRKILHLTLMEFRMAPRSVRVT